MAQKTVAARFDDLDLVGEISFIQFGEERLFLRSDFPRHDSPCPRKSSKV